MLQFKKPFSLSVSLRALSGLYSAFHAEFSQSDCKPNQITEFCVIPMIQKVSNCGKCWVEIELVKNKMKSTQTQTSRGVEIKLTNICIYIYIYIHRHD